MHFLQSMVSRDAVRGSVASCCTKTRLRAGTGKDANSRSRHGPVKGVPLERRPVQDANVCSVAETTITAKMPKGAKRSRGETLAGDCRGFVDRKRAIFLDGSFKGFP
jgi:hypothetical protein